MLRLLAPNRAGLGYAALTPSASLPSARGSPPKLAVGQVDNPLEHDADRVADRVIGAATERPTAGNPATVDPTADVPASVHETLRSSGQPLYADARAYFERRFGRDFGDVRVHSSDAAAASAQAMEAKAYTVGRHIVFAPEQYSPRTQEGRALLAHELAHVVQQSASIQPRVQRVVELRPPGRLEASAFDRRQEIVDRMNGLSAGIAYTLAGQRIAYTLNDPARLTPFDRQMQGFIDRAEVVPLRLITSAGRVGTPATGFQNLLVDFFDSAYVDVDDLRASDDNSFKMSLVHLLSERFAVRDYERRIGTDFTQADFDRAHAIGLQTEAQCLRDTVGDPTIRFVFEETRPDGTLVFGFRSNEGYSIFHVFRRTQQAVSGGHVFVQTRDNRRVTVDALIAERAAAASRPRAGAPGTGAP